MPITKIKTHNLDNFAITTDKMANTAVAAFAQSLAPKVLYANVANSAFTVLDDTAVNIGGGYIVVTGSDFQSGATVLIDTTSASAVTFVNSTTLRVQVPTKAAASYNLYVVNPDGGVGIKVNGITYSSNPSWVTSSPLSNQNANTAFNVTLSANDATSYAVAAGSTLPAGTTLAANGYFYGTVSIGAETTYTFDVVATDAELQDSSKTFQVTVTVAPLLKLFAWGNNNSGQLGLNDTVRRSSPVQVGTEINWSSLGGVTNYSSAAIKTDGTLWTWGPGYYSLGHNDTLNKSSPTQVGSGTNWSKVCNLAYVFLAIKTDGTLWTWGSNSYGQLGLNDTVSRSSPTQIGTGTNWSKLPVGGNSFFCAAIKTDGTLWTWGNNGSGNLGHGDTVHRSSPTQVGSATTWDKGQTYNDKTAAIKTDGTLWTWGSSPDGTLGHNNTVSRSIPTQVGTGTNWSVASIANKMAGGIKTDGTLWTWGNGEEFSGGTLGLNDNVVRSSPTQVGAGTTWLDLNVGYRVLALRT